jgi:aminodeoxychorismate synthase component I
MSHSMFDSSSHRFLSSSALYPLSVVVPLPADPYGIYQRLARPGRTSVLLESANGSPQTARYSFIVTDPYVSITSRGPRCEVAWRDGGKTLTSEDGFATVVREFDRETAPRDPSLPPFIGGAVGLLGYAIASRFERWPSPVQEDEEWPALALGFYEMVAAVDHASARLHLIYCPPPLRWRSEPRDKLYREGTDRLAEWHARLTGRPEPVATCPRYTIEPEQDRNGYGRRVRDCQDYIRAGDIYQANLSHRFRLAPHGDADGVPAAQWYERVRTSNPSPFSGLFQGDDLTLVCSSPERLVRVDGTRVETRPIAGTRPRGRTAATDAALVRELQSNPKECAEHLMLVDLARNDVGRVCRYGTVRVDAFMALEQYSRVTHLVSNVSGHLREGATGFDALRAVFPGGTITGVPKIRCMEIIDTLEPVRRGPYTGSLGYVSWSGHMDFNILIRTIQIRGSRAYLHTGAGIVADSSPDAEYDETLHKAAALLDAVTGLP